MEKHEEESRKDRKAILDILCSYEKVTDSQYKEIVMWINAIPTRIKLYSSTEDC